VFSAPEAITDMRVVAGFSLTLGIVIASSIVSKRRALFGNIIVAWFMLLVLAIRLFGFAQDGTTLSIGDQRVKTIREALFLGLNAVAIALYFIPARMLHLQRRPPQITSIYK
jgi:hypothetical protein